MSLYFNPKEMPELTEAEKLQFWILNNYQHKRKFLINKWEKQIWIPNNLWASLYQIARMTNDIRIWKDDYSSFALPIFENHRDHVLLVLEKIAKRKRLEKNKQHWYAVREAYKSFAEWCILFDDEESKRIL